MGSIKRSCLLILWAFSLLVLKGDGWNIPWWRLTGKVLLAIDRFKIITSEHPIDFSAGAVQLSNPDKDTHPLVAMRKKRVNGTEIDAPDDDYNKPQLLLAHQMGKKVVKNLPDAALLGVMVLILSELLQRETKTNFVRLPPVLRAIVNETAEELDTKLEYLSSMQWSVEPFLRTELENLQKQPLELLDKYIVTDILPRVDKEISPVLNSLVGDPKTVSQITQNIKDLIQVTSVVLVQSSDKNDWSWEDFIGLREKKREEEKKSPLDQTTATILDGVDSIGDLAEKGIEAWNDILFSLKQSTKRKSVFDYTTGSAASQVNSIWNVFFGGTPTSLPPRRRLGMGRPNHYGKTDFESDFSGVPIPLEVSPATMDDSSSSSSRSSSSGGSGAEIEPIEGDSDVNGGHTGVGADPKTKGKGKSAGGLLGASSFRRNKRRISIGEYDPSI